MKHPPRTNTELLQEVSTLRAEVEGLESYVDKYVNVFKFSKDAILLINPATEEIIDANQVALEMLGFERAELLATPISAIHPDDLPRFKQFAKTVVQDGFGWTNELACRTKAQRQLLTEMSASVAHLNGKACIIAMIRDISMRKRAEEALHQSEKKFRGLMESAPDAIVVTDETGNIVLVNAQTVELFGYTQKELIGNSLEILMPERYRQNHKDLRKQYGIAPHARPMGIGLELNALRKNGEEFPVEIGLSPLGQEKGFLAICILRDLTERKRLDTEIKMMASFARLNPAPVFRLDEQGLILLANPAASEYFPNTELIGNHWQKVCPGIEDCFYARVVEEGSVAQEFDLNGNTVSLLYRSVPEDQIIHVYGFDVSDRKQAELALQSLNETLEGRVDKRTRELQESLGRLESTLEGTIRAMAHVVDIRDPYTAGHQERVAQLARAIAEDLGFDEHTIDGIFMTALIHDIGKINVPAEILNKPGKLTENEFAIIKEHAQIGSDIMWNIDFPWPVSQVILQHHERLDGSGYPHGLTEKDIRVEARILAVADVVEAMSSHRPYRPALGIEVALQEIEDNAGRLYDKAVVRSCLKLFEKGFNFS